MNKPRFIPSVVQRAIRLGEIHENEIFSVSAYGNAFWMVNIKDHTGVKRPFKWSQNPLPGNAIRLNPVKNEPSTLVADNNKKRGRHPKPPCN